MNRETQTWNLMAEAVDIGRRIRDVEVGIEGAEQQLQTLELELWDLLRRINLARQGRAEQVS